MVPNAERHDNALFNLEEVFEAEDYLYFYSQALTEARTEAEVAALVKYLELDQPASILDLACGFGRHTNRLAALGHRMTGIDLTPGFLEIARRDAQARGVQVEYRQGDMRDLDDQEKFERVMLVFTAFGYFEDEGNLLVLKNVARALKPGGLFVFDIQNRDVYLKHIAPAFVIEKEGNFMIDRISFDPISGRSENRRIVLRDGKRKDKPFSIRLYNATEIRELLGRAGLAVHQVYNGWEGTPLSADSRRMVIVARK